MSGSIPLGLVGLVGAALLILIALVRDLDAARALDSASRGYLTAIPIPLLAEIGDLMTWLGDPAVSSGAAVLLAIALRQRRTGAAWLAPLLIVGTIGIEVGLKAMPFGQLASYPSGHVARIVFLSIVAGALYGAWAVRPTVALVAALTILTRVSSGVHPLMDVLGGLGLGAATGSAAVVYVQLRDRKDAVPVAIGQSDRTESG